MSDEPQYDGVMQISQASEDSVLVYTSLVNQSKQIQHSKYIYHDHEQWECKNRTLVLLKNFDLESDEDFQQLGLTKDSVQVLVDCAWVKSIRVHAQAKCYLESVNPNEIFEIFTLDACDDGEQQPSPLQALKNFIVEAECCSDYSIAKTGLAKTIQKIKDKFSLNPNVSAWALP